MTNNMDGGNVSYSTISVLAPFNTELSSDTIISDSALILIQWILFTGICQIIAVFGTGSNIVNIICFCKQGIKDSISISFLGLAVSDLGCLVTLIWVNLCFLPVFSEADLTFDVIEVTYVSVGVLYVSFTRVTCWVTAFITLERCLCITAPLKVKMIITPKRTIFLIVCFFVVNIISPAPFYAVNRLGSKFFPNRNKTLIGHVITEDRAVVDKFTFMINNMIVPCIAFLIMFVCTIILVTMLHIKNKWRQKTTTIVQADNISLRNQKVAKMVMIISILFIVCFAPISIVYLGASMEPSFSMDGKKRNLIIVMGGLGIFMQTINSSVNIFVYYHMSSKYREVLLSIFRYKCR